MNDVYVKQYVDTGVSLKKHFGLNHIQSFNLELSCLKRIKGYSNMCQLLDYDADTTTLYLKWAGHNLNYYIDPIKKYEKHKRRSKKLGIDVTTAPPVNNLILTKLEFEEQIHSVFDTFEKLNIVHFDLGPWNICVHEHSITIIDFGCVILDGVPVDRRLQEPYNRFLLDGGWSNQRTNVLQRINSCLQWN